MISRRLYTSLGSTFLEQSNRFPVQQINKCFTTAHVTTVKPRENGNPDENTAIYRINELFMSDIENILDPVKKAKFLNNNKAQIAAVDYEFIKRMYGKHSLLAHTSKFVNTLTTNPDVKREFMKLAKSRINATYLPSILECGWYFLLSEDEAYKREFLKPLVPAIKKEIAQDFNKKSPLRQKVMLSQLVFNYAMLFSKEMGFNGVPKLTEGVEHIALDDFTMDFYLKLADILDSNGIEVASVSDFAEIYYTGIELKDKVLIDIHKVNTKSDTKVYKVIRERNLTDMGYKVIPFVINPLEEGNKGIASRIIQKLKDQ